jgi:hypothetical protein
VVQECRCSLLQGCTRKDVWCSATALDNRCPKPEVLPNSRRGLRSPATALQEVERNPSCRAARRKDVECARQSLPDARIADQIEPRARELQNTAWMRGWSNCLGSYGPDCELHLPVVGPDNAPAAAEAAKQAHLVKNPAAHPMCCTRMRAVNAKSMQA